MVLSTESCLYLPHVRQSMLNYISLRRFLSTFQGNKIVVSVIQYIAYYYYAKRRSFLIINSDLLGSQNQTDCLTDLFRCRNEHGTFLWNRSGRGRRNRNP